VSAMINGEDDSFVIKMLI